MAGAVPESLKGGFVGVGSELARGRSSVEEVKSGREDMLRGRDQGRGTVAFSGEAGGGLGGPRIWCPQRQVGSLGFAQGRWCLHLPVGPAGKMFLIFLFSPSGSQPVPTDGSDARQAHGQGGRGVHGHGADDGLVQVHG